MANCGLIAAGASYDCENPLQGGVSSKLRLLNLSEITGVTEDVTTDNLLTDITIASGGKAAWAFEGYRNSMTPSHEAILPDTGQTLYKHQVNFFVFDIGQTVKNTIQQLALGRFVAIVENAGKNEDSFEILGLNGGLELVPGALRNANENNGAYNIILATPDNEGEAKLPQTLFITDYATTLAQVIAYETPTA